MMEDEFAKHTLFAYPDVTSRFGICVYLIIQILQNRQASIESRLLVLGIFMRKYKLLKRVTGNSGYLFI